MIFLPSPPSPPSSELLVSRHKSVPNSAKCEGSLRGPSHFTEFGPEFNLGLTRDTLIEVVGQLLRTRCNSELFGTDREGFGIVQNMREIVRTGS